MTRTIGYGYERARALGAVAQAQVEAGNHVAAQSLLDEAVSMARAIEDTYVRERVLVAVAQAQVEAGRWEEAVSMVRTIEHAPTQTGMLRIVTQGLGNAGETGRLLRLVQQSWLQAETRVYLLMLLPMAMSLVPFNPKIAEGIVTSFEWVDNFGKS